MENDPKPAASRLRATTMANTTLLIAERAWSNRFPPSFPSSSLDALIISVLSLSGSLVVAARGSGRLIGVSGAAAAQCAATFPRTWSARCAAIGMAEVAAGDGAFATCSMRSVLRK